MLSKKELYKCILAQDKKICELEGKLLVGGERQHTGWTEFIDVPINSIIYKILDHLNLGLKATPEVKAKPANVELVKKES